MTDEEICLILDTYMYTNYKYAKDDMTLAEIVAEMPEYIDVEGQYYKEYCILKEAVKDPLVGELMITCQSQNMGYNEGTNAATFVSQDGDKVYITYRGTYDGEWIDNGRGLTEVKTTQQDEAVRYYEEVAESLELSKNQHVVVTGHSKGGNKAQYVTMESSYSDVIDICYSVDGQGQSEEAINYWKDKYSKAEYEERINKLYAINGENDYVSVLGECIIPLSHIKYIETPGEADDIAAFHDITRMFGHYVEGEDGKKTLVFDATKNNYVASRGELSAFVASLSLDVMTLPPFLLDGCAISLMQLAEIGLGGKWFGINKERVRVKDLFEFKQFGIPIILRNLFLKKEGIDFIRILLKESQYSRKFNENDDIYINYNMILESADELNDIASKITDLAKQIEIYGLALPFYMDGVTIRKEDMNQYVLDIMYKVVKLKTLSTIEKGVGELYRDYDLSL